MQYDIATQLILIGQGLYDAEHGLIKDALKLGIFPFRFIEKAGIDVVQLYCRAILGTPGINHNLPICVNDPDPDIQIGIYGSQLESQIVNIHILDIKVSEILIPNQIGFRKQQVNLIVFYLFLQQMHPICIQACENKYDHD
jgi:hypothetical protein